ncbi:glycosyltransferase 87 family protein [Streptomyces sp. cg28]|uniref:glycosyltransferase 87 family protein n=1 Tax=Streptomyces sp. cg28 TaxID=3403457 RepID=UPI003B20CF25
MTLDTRPSIPAPVFATWVRPGPLARAALPAAWLATRAGMVALLLWDGLGTGGVTREVSGLYTHWYGILARGAFPSGDPLWQYPPGAGPVLLAPGLLPSLTYLQAFVALTLVADALIAFVLARGGREPRGAWLWVAGLPLLLHIPLARFDVLVTALAVLALLVTARSPRAAGALAALGALVKVWPALTLLGMPRGRSTKEAWTAAVASGAALLAVLTLAFDAPLSFLSGQSGRGVQIESLGGTALMTARHFGWPGQVRYRYGAFEVVGPHVELVAAGALALTVVAFAVLLWWRTRARAWSEATPYDAALCAVLMFTVTSRVISPQYLVWLLGLTAVCLTSRYTTQARVAPLILAAAALSSLTYPVLYADVLAGTWTGCAVTAARNALLAGAVFVSFRSLRKGTEE